MRQAWRSFLAAITPLGYRATWPSIARLADATASGLTFYERKIVWKGRQDGGTIPKTGEGDAERDEPPMAARGYPERYADPRKLDLG